MFMTMVAKNAAGHALRLIIAVWMLALHQSSPGGTSQTSPSILQYMLSIYWGTQEGGLSGQPLMELSTEVLKDMYRHTRGRVPLIGCGGVCSGEDAYRKIRAGGRFLALSSLLYVCVCVCFAGPAYPDQCFGVWRFTPVCGKIS